MGLPYENLKVGEEILGLINKVYQCSNSFPDHEHFGLTSQLRRASVSVYLNLAEGATRRGRKDFARFINVSVGSLIETHACLKIATRRKYIMQPAYQEFDEEITRIWRRLWSLYHSINPVAS